MNLMPNVGDFRALVYIYIYIYIYYVLANSLSLLRFDFLGYI